MASLSTIAALLSVYALAACSDGATSPVSVTPDAGPDTAVPDTGTDAGADAEDAAADVATDTSDAGADTGADVAAPKSHLRWKMELVGAKSIPDPSFLIEGDAMTFFTSADAYPIRVATANADGYRLTPLTGLTNMTLPMGVGRGASGATFGIAHAKVDNHPAIVSAAWNAAGELQSSTVLPSFDGAFKSALFDADGSMVVAVDGGLSSSALLVGFDAKGQQSFEMDLAPGFDAKLVRAADGTIVVAERLMHLGPLHLVARASDGSQRWTMDLDPKAVPGDYAITATGNQIVVAHHSAGPSDVTTLNAADGSVIREAHVDGVVTKIAALPSGEAFVAYSGQRVLVKVDASGKEMWRENLDSIAQAISLDGAGHVYVLTSVNGDQEAASFDE